jgi:hypothetical protein
MKTIQKEDLLKLGFNETFVPFEESGDSPYFYYTYDMNNDCILISNCSDEVIDGFSIELFNHPIVGKIREFDDLVKLINSLKFFK